jgi:hypothetical protein
MHLSLCNVSLGNLSLPQAANGRFVAVNSEPPPPGVGRLLPDADTVTVRRLVSTPKGPLMNGSFR